MRRSIHAGIVFAVLLTAIFPPVRQPSADAGPAISWTIEELLAHSPSPRPSQTVGNDLMLKHQSDPNFLDVILDGPTSVRVVIKGAKDREEFRGDISISWTGSAYSRADYDRVSADLMRSDQSVHRVTTDSDAQALIVTRYPEALGRKLDDSAIPTDISLTVEYAYPEPLAAAEGGSGAGYRQNASSVTASCTVPVYVYSGGTLASVPGDSGGPYVTLVYVPGAGYSYSARGTHRGGFGNSMAVVRMSTINALGYYVA